MIQRKALESLQKWREDKWRKPLVLRGARQVGKTTLVREFAREDKSVLLFIDEIQFSKPAVAILRYFYEEANYIHVIVAGSLLETVIDVRKISFPVGRVQFMAIRPCSFLEFLSGTGHDFDAELIENLTDISGIHFKIIELFYKYILVGGMPAAIAKYVENQDILAVKDVYESLLFVKGNFGSVSNDSESHATRIGLPDFFGSNTFKSEFSQTSEVDLA